MSATNQKVSSDLYREEYQPSFVEKWDDLIDWERRAEGEDGFFVDALREAGCERVIDVACGTGFHSVTLARAGFDVLASDGSPRMLEKTRENARERGVDLPVQQADWRWLSDQVEERFDALLCLGNAFTHLFTHDERVQAMRQFHRVLKPGGLAVIDQRNYDAILDEGFSTKHRYYYCGEEVEARPEEIADTHVRFRYRFPDGSVHHLTLYPIRQQVLTGLMLDSGFRRVRRYGDFESDYAKHEPDFIVQIGEA